jgi:hypothetical protein
MSVHWTSDFTSVLATPGILPRSDEQVRPLRPPDARKRGGRSAARWVTPSVGSLGRVSSNPNAVVVVHCGLCEHDLGVRLTLPVAASDDELRDAARQTLAGNVECPRCHSRLIPESGQVTLAEPPNMEVARAAQKMERRIKGVRWAVGTPTGPRGSIWRLWVNGNDVYIAARIVAADINASLHASGQFVLRSQRSTLQGPHLSSIGRAIALLRSGNVRPSSLRVGHADSRSSFRSRRLSPPMSRLISATKSFGSRDRRPEARLTSTFCLLGVARRAQKVADSLQQKETR